jgi:hypothetical protein
MFPSRTIIPPFAALALAACDPTVAGLDSGAPDATATRPADTEDLRPEALLPDPDAAEVPLADAERVVQRFVGIRAEVSPTWRDATVGAAEVFTDGAGGRVLAEYPVYGPDGSPAGAVTVSLREGRSVVSSYVTAGHATAPVLRARAAVLVDGEPEDVELVATDAATLGVAFSGRLRGDAPDTLALDAASGRHVLLPSLPGVAEIDLAAGAPHLVWTDPGAVEEEADLRWLYAAGSDEKLADRLLGGARASVDDDGGLGVTNAVGSGAAEFSVWQPENRSWSSGRCYTGCVVLAGGLVVEYWDRHGYSGLVDGQGKRRQSDGDIRDLLDDLRGHMSTTCVGTEGSTSPGRADDGLDDYAAARGYGGFTTRNYLVGNRVWSRLRSQIDSGRPVVLHLFPNMTFWGRFTSIATTKHAVAVYEYEDKSGSSDDWICSMHGYVCTDSSTMCTEGWKCWNRREHAWDRMTRFTPG